MTYLDRFDEAQRASLDLLADTFRKYWHTPLARIHVTDAALLSLDLFGATNAVIPDAALRHELARRTYTILMHDGGGVQPASEAGTVQRAYHDEAAQRRWSHEVIVWLGDLIGHLQDEAARSAATH